MISKDEILPIIGWVRLFIDSCDWNNCGGPLIVPKCCVVGKTGPPEGNVTGGDLFHKKKKNLKIKEEEPI